MTELDAVHHYAKVERPADASGGAPEAIFLLPDAWMVFDRLRSRIALVAGTAHARATADGGDVWDEAVRRLDEMGRASRRRRAA